MKIKLFEALSLENLNEQISQWQKDTIADIISCMVSQHSLHDLYQGIEPSVCNTWINHVAVVIYKL